MTQTVAHEHLTSTPCPACGVPPLPSREAGDTPEGPTLRADRLHCADCPTHNLTDDEAYDHAVEYKHCVTALDDPSCVYCKRWDH
jgi:hypothetical protein